MAQEIEFSVVTPAYNEADGIEAFHARISDVMRSLNAPYELVFVNDGSRDDTLAKMRRLRAQDRRISIVDLS